MHHYGCLVPKPHYGWSNSPYITALDKGKLLNWKKRQSPGDDSPKVQTCKSYVNKEGKRCYTGTAFLRKTERLAIYISGPFSHQFVCIHLIIFGVCICDLWFWFLGSLPTTCHCLIIWGSIQSASGFRWLTFSMTWRGRPAGGQLFQTSSLLQ